MMLEASNRLLKIEGYTTPNGKTVHISAKIKEISQHLGSSLVIAAGANDAYDGKIQNFLADLKKP